MWRGSLFSVVLHGGLMIGLIGTLPMLPRIFDRDREPESTELQIAVDVVNAETLQRLSQLTGGDAPAPPAASANTAAPPPLSARAASPAAPPRTAETPSGSSRRAATSSPGSAPPQSREAAAQTLKNQIPQGTLHRSIQVITPASQPGGRAGAKDDGRAGDTSGTAVASGAPGGAVAGAAGRSAEAAENVFLTAASGRKRALVEEALAQDARLRRATTPADREDDIPEAARRKTLDRLNNAAKAGFAHAQYNLAGKYLRGEHVDRNPVEAKKWLTRAAEQGYAPAQSLLALMLFTGQGADQDRAEAAFWWSLAAEAGNPGARAAQARLRSLLKPGEHVRAQRLRARWGSLINDLADAATGDTTRRELDRDLQEAAEKGDVDAVLSLLARGADADESGDAGRNAVINAAWRGRQRIIQILLERGVATELPDEGGRTPLIWAAINGHEQVVADLIASGANPNRRDGDGRTALIRAAWNGHSDVVAQLIAAGADLNRRDHNGLTALAHARREGNRKAIELLESAGAR